MLILEAREMSSAVSPDPGTITSPISLITAFLLFATNVSLTVVILT